MHVEVREAQLCQDFFDFEDRSVSRTEIWIEKGFFDLQVVKRAMCDLFLRSGAMSFVPVCGNNSPLRLKRSATGGCCETIS